MMFDDDIFKRYVWYWSWVKRFLKPVLNCLKNKVSKVYSSITLNECKTEWYLPNTPFAFQIKNVNFVLILLKGILSKMTMTYHFKGQSRDTPCCPTRRIQHKEHQPNNWIELVELLLRDTTHSQTKIGSTTSSLTLCLIIPAVTPNTPVSFNCVFFSWQKMFTYY